MKKLATVIAVTLLAACETMPPQDRAQWDNTSVNDVNCEEYGDFGTTEGYNYGMGAVLIVLGVAVAPTMPILAAADLGLGIGSIATASSTAEAAKFCSEFHEYKKNGNAQADQAEYEAFKTWKQSQD